MATTQELENQLAQAEQARHKIMTGKSTVSISYAGRSVTYNQANLSDLNVYISELKMRLGRGGRRSKGVFF